MKRPDAGFWLVIAFAMMAIGNLMVCAAGIARLVMTSGHAP